MKQLKQEYKKNGHTLTQLKRGLHRALYAIFLKGRLVGYETIKVREVRVNSNLTEDYERYPTNEELGHYAWSYQDLGMALEKYDLL